MEYGERDVVRMALHCLHAAFTEIVPYFHGLVIASRHEVGPVGAWVELDVVDTFFVRFHRVIWGGRTDGPHFYSTIKA